MSNLSGSMGLIQGANSVVSGFTQANAAKMEGQYTQNQDNMNAQLASIASEQAGIQGNEELQGQAMDTAQTAGKIQASYAGQGVEVNSGSAANTASNFSNVANINEGALKNKIWQTQFGYSLQSQEDINAGALAEASANTNATADITAGITTGLSYGAKAYEDFYQGSAANVSSSSSSGVNLSTSTLTQAYDQESLNDGPHLDTSSANMSNISF